MPSSHPSALSILRGLIALLGLWEFGDVALPFVIGFGGVRPLVWSHIAAGLVLMIAGVWAALTADPAAARLLDRIAALAGAWLIVAPFVLRARVLGPALWNDLVVGALVLLLSAISLSSPPPHNR